MIVVALSCQDIAVDPGLEEFFGDLLIFGSVHDVIDGDDSGIGHAVRDLYREFLGTDNVSAVGRDLHDLAVGDPDIGQAVGFQHVLQDDSAHGGGTHTCVAYEHDLVYGPEVYHSAAGRSSSGRAFFRLPGLRNRRRGCLAVSCQLYFDQGFCQFIIFRGFHVVADRKMLLAGLGRFGGTGQLLMGDDQVYISRNSGDGVVGDFDGQARCLDLLLQCLGAHGRGAHAGVAAYRDLSYIGQIQTGYARVDIIDNVIPGCGGTHGFRGDHRFTHGHVAAASDLDPYENTVQGQRNCR